MEHQQNPEEKYTKISYKKLYNDEKQKRKNIELKWEEQNKEIDKLKLEPVNSHIKEKNSIVKQCSNDQDFWRLFTENSHNIKDMIKQIEYLLNEFGTKEPCNRFDVGNTIEFITGECILKVGLKCNELPNAKRFDIEIDNYKKLSIKYSSVGDITLHNANSCVNKDMKMKDTILITLDKLILITNTELCKYNIKIEDYLDNKGDSLKLKRKILKELEKIHYPFILDINIKYNKSECKHRLCSKTFYKVFKDEYESLNK
jgi:hypothetical protein